MTLAIVDERMPEEAKRRLSLLGFYVLEAPPSRSLPPPLASHPDMIMLSIGKTIISSCEYMDEHPWFFEDISRLVPGLRIILSNDSYGKEYPHDAIFNSLVMGNKIFLKSDTVSQAVIDYAKSQELQITSVKQGYPACTTLAISDNMAITADPGMESLLSKKGISVLKIENGGISLPPYEYGFIGGASGAFRDKIYFIGNLMTHPDGKKIEAAIKSAGKICVSLTSGPLVDLGRIIFIEDDIQNHG